MAITGICEVEGCNNPIRVKAYGLCNRHYIKYRTWGSPTGGASYAIGDPERFYQNTILQYDGDECIEWPYATDRANYARMTHNGRLWTVSRRLCAELFGPPPTASHHAAHNCGNGNKKCVNKNHVRWATPAENNADKIIHGTLRRGRQIAGAILDEEKIRQIRVALSGKNPNMTAIGRDFGVTDSSIRSIRDGKTWKHVT